MSKNRPAARGPELLGAEYALYILFLPVYLVFYPS